MKYYLDNNALIKLYFKKKDNLLIYKKTNVSKLLIAEILKVYNWEKDYDQRRNQLKFITENGININWKSFDSIISKAFCGKEILDNPLGSIFNHTPSIFVELKTRYNTFMENETFDTFVINYCRKSSFMQHDLAEKISTDLTGEYKSMVGDLIKTFYNASFIQDNMLNYEKYLLDNNDNKKTYEIEKEIKNDFIKTIIEYSFRNKSLSDAKEKHLFRSMTKDYNKSLDLFIKCKAKYIFDKDDEDVILRNDGVDLLYLLYVNISDGDIFVTDDGNLRRLIKSISEVSTINVDEYLNINNEYDTNGMRNGG
jgi:hypothetical protein